MYENINIDDVITYKQKHQVDKCHIDIVHYISRSQSRLPYCAVEYRKH